LLGRRPERGEWSLGHARHEPAASHVDVIRPRFTWLACVTRPATTADQPRGSLQ
jgi:hypothetical protein